MKDYLSNLDNLLDYQIPCVESLLNTVRINKRALDGGDMGVGKTFMACAVVRELGLPTVVVAPKSSLSKWEAVGDLTGGQVTAINYEQLVRCKVPHGEFYMDRGVKRWRWHPNIKFLIFDECHRCGGTTTGNQKLMVAAVHQDIRGLALSATAAENPSRMKALGYFLNLFGGEQVEKIVKTPAGIRSRFVKSMAVAEPFKKWAERHGCRDGFNGWGYYGKPHHMQKVHDLIYPLKGYRLQVDKIPGFPQTKIVAELVDFDAKKMQAHYIEMQKELERLEEKCATWNPEDPMFQKLRERQEIDLLKVPAYVERAHDAVAEGRSMALFVPYRATLTAVCERLKVPYSKIWGGQSAKERAQQIDRFQIDESRVCVTVNQAGCESIDLHDVRGEFPRVADITPPYEAWMLRQITGRVRRAGGKSKSYQRIMCAKGTYEETIYKNLVKKSLNLDALNDRDLDPLKYKLQ